MDFHALARLYHFRALLRERGAPWPLSRTGSHTGCVPIKAKNVPDKPRLTRALLQSKGDRRDV